MRKEYLILILILLLAFFLRFVLLTEIPPELNRDEVSVGYNAYSLLETHRDEHDRGPWPLVFKAFGDYKIPGYIYLTMPLIKWFGLNAFSVRFPAAFFGSLTILMIYLFCKEIFPKKSNLALLSSLILSFSPFHLHYSRQQFEATVALFFTTAALFFLLKARSNKKMLIFSGISFIISFFLYNSPLFISLPLILWTFIIFKKDFLNKTKENLISLLFILLITFSIWGYWSLVKEGNRGRANTTIFNENIAKEYVNNNIHFLTNKNIPITLSRIFYNKPIYWFNEYFKNYLAAFNPKFIFITGDNNPWHGLGYLNTGNILIIFLPFIIIGLIKFCQNIKLKENQWLLGYLLITPIANGLTIDSPILTRLLDFHLALVIISAIGIINFLEDKQLKSNIIWLAKNYITVGLIIIFTINYLINYFLIYPQFVSKEDFWLTGIKEITLTIKTEESKYDFIFLDSKAEVGYIFFAFYIPFDPKDFQFKAVWKFDGFEKVKSYQKYIFDKDSNELNKIDEIKAEYGSGKKILLIEKLPYRANPTNMYNRNFIYNSLKEPVWQLTSINT